MLVRLVLKYLLIMAETLVTVTIRNQLDCSEKDLTANSFSTTSLVPLEITKTASVGYPRSTMLLVVLEVDIEELREINFLPDVALTIFVPWFFLSETLPNKPLFGRVLPHPSLTSYHRESCPRTTLAESPKLHLIKTSWRWTVKSNIIIEFFCRKGT